MAKSDDIYLSIKNLLTSKELLSYDIFFKILNDVSDLLENEKTNYRSVARDGRAGGLIDFHKDSLPVVVIPDLHARPDFLMNILDFEIFDNCTIYEALKNKKLRLVSVGDLLHTERNTRVRWAIAGTEFDAGNFTGPAMMAEMQEGLNLESALFSLKIAFPEYVHILKGNHENILNQTGNGDFAFCKYADEGYMGKTFVQEYYGEDILYLISCVEKNLPLFYFGKKCMVSHAEPKSVYTREELINARLEKGVVEGLTWTDNGEAMPGSVLGIIENLTEEKKWAGDYVYIGGHRPVQGNYKYRQNGLFIQIHNPSRQIITIVYSDREFNPETDIIGVKK